jgi:hypothetical protein
MVPAEKFRLPLRWEFVPVRQEQDRSIHWKWRAYTQSGTLKMQSDSLFETLSGCIDDAKSRGYDPATGS